MARAAAAGLPAGTAQTWLDLARFALGPFIDTRHEGDGIYPAPEGAAATLLGATLAATDLVLVTPLYWYTVSAPAKLYLDHWAGWLRVPGANFRATMAGRSMWAVSSASTAEEREIAPLLSTVEMSAEYMRMRWRGALVGHASKPGEAMQQPGMAQRAATFFN